MRPSHKQIKERQKEEEEFVQEGMDMDRSADSDTSSIAAPQSEGSPDVLLIDESDMEQEQDALNWSRKLGEALAQDHHVETSAEMGVRVMVTRAAPTVATAAPTVTVAAPKVITAAPTEPQTSKEKTAQTKRIVQTMKQKMRWDRDEDMEVDGDQAAVRVSTDLRPEQLKDRLVHQILAQIPLRLMQPNEKATGRMRQAAYCYCIQSQDGVEVDECEW